MEQRLGRLLAIFVAISFYLTLALYAFNLYAPAGRELTREGFLDAMESIRDWDSGGIMPPVSFSSSDHHAQTDGFVCELRDGRFEALTDWISP